MSSGADGDEEDGRSKFLRRGLIGFLIGTVGGVVMITMATGIAQGWFVTYGQCTAPAEWDCEESEKNGFAEISEAEYRYVPTFNGSSISNDFSCSRYKFTESVMQQIQVHRVASAVPLPDCTQPPCFHEPVHHLASPPFAPPSPPLAPPPLRINSRHLALEHLVRHDKEECRQVAPKLVGSSNTCFLDEGSATCYAGKKPHTEYSGALEKALLIVGIIFLAACIPCFLSLLACHSRKGRCDCRSKPDYTSDSERA